MMVISPTPEQQRYVHDNTTEKSPNWTFESGACSDLYLDYWISISSLLVALVGLVGNSLVLWLLSFRIQRNPFSVYILNLAGADALFLCCSIVVSILQLSSSLNHPSQYLGLRYLRATSHCVGLSLLLGISTERCLAVLFPMWFRSHRKRQRSAAVCAVLWALPALVWLAFFVQCVSQLSDHICNIILIIRLVWFIIVTCVLCLSSLTLLLRVQCSSQRQQPPRLYLLVLLNVLVFLLCGLPLEIMDFIMRFWKICLSLWAPWLLACVNSSANPFIYFFLGRQRHKRREALSVVLERALEDELGDGTSDSPPNQQP
ncbi:mas-related G-protein coupled receptor member X2-like [Macrotis lagotis]|uniref:mas-related G-protein coupled receptor member X2-like n=1 Tax=Macrotis lagotis TaxID=92651 RepID=UPI003D68B847